MRERMSLNELWPVGYFDQSSVSDILWRILAVRANLSKGPVWAGYENARKAVASTMAADFVRAAVDGELAYPDTNRSFRRAFFAKWLSACLKQRPLLERFQTLSHDERVAEF